MWERLVSLLRLCSSFNNLDQMLSCMLQKQRQNGQASPVSRLTRSSYTHSNIVRHCKDMRRGKRVRTLPIGLVYFVRLKPHMPLGVATWLPVRLLIGNVQRATAVSRYVPTGGTDHGLRNNGVAVTKQSVAPSKSKMDTSLVLP